MPLRASPTTSTTVHSPYVTLVPGSPQGSGLPGDASDGADFWGIGLALLVIVVAVVVVRLAFRPRRRRGRHVRR